MNISWGTDRGRKYATEDDNLTLERILKTSLKPCSNLVKSAR